MIDAHVNTTIPLPPGAAEAISQARQDALTGKPGNLHFVVEVKRANGTVETHHLIGRVSLPQPLEDEPC